MFWIVRMKQWAQNPPSPARIKLVFSVVALCLAIVFIEYYIGWPDWMTADRVHPRMPSLR